MARCEYWHWLSPSLVSSSFWMELSISVLACFMVLALAKASSFSPRMMSTGLIFKRVPRAAAAGVIRPPFFKYLSVSTVIKITESPFVSSRRSLILAPSAPWAASISASFTDWYWVTETLWLSTTNTFPS